MQKPLTKKQAQILEYITNYIEENNISPSYYEIQDHFGFKSIHAVQRHLQALIKKRHIKKVEGVKRGLTLVRQESGAVEVPIVGVIAAGNPIESLQDGVASFPAQMIKPSQDYYALKVKGDSMDNGGVKGILDGDIILVKSQPDIEFEGQIAVILNSRWEASLKRVYHDKKLRKYRLKSDNPNYKDMLWSPSNTKVQGVYVGLVRN